MVRFCAPQQSPRHSSALARATKLAARYSPAFRPLKLVVFLLKPLFDVAYSHGYVPNNMSNQNPPNRPLEPVTAPKASKQPRPSPPIDVLLCVLRAPFSPPGDCRSTMRRTQGWGKKGAGRVQHRPQAIELVAALSGAIDAGLRVRQPAFGLHVWHIRWRSFAVQAVHDQRRQQ